MYIYLLWRWGGRDVFGGWGGFLSLLELVIELMGRLRRKFDVI